MAIIDLSTVGFVGTGLDRPECILCPAQGELYVSDRRGAFTHIAADGTQSLHGAGLACEGRKLLVNGFDLLHDGSALVTQLNDPGGVWQLWCDGRFAPLLLEVDGVALPGTNFVHADMAGRVWITVSTRMSPRSMARTPDLADGFIVLVDGRGARIVAGGLCFTNEAKVDPSGRYLYVNQTYRRMLSRFAIRENGDLGPCETVATFRDGTFPDGLTFDAEGGVWITSPYSNGLVRVAPDGKQQVYLDDVDPDVIAEIEDRYARNDMVSAPVITGLAPRQLGIVSSLAFGGPRMTTGYLGSLQGTRVTKVELPVAGIKPPHWGVAFGTGA